MIPPSRVRRLLWLWYRRRRFALLFAVLLLTLAGHSFFNTLSIAGKPSEWLLAVNIAGVLLSVEAPPRALRLVGAILAFARLPQTLIAVPILHQLSQVLWAGACVLATIATMSVAFRRGRIDRERIFAVLDAYLLTGVIFGLVYALVDEIHPGSFHTPAGGAMRFEQGVYLSFVVLTSLGFGEVLPVTGVARGLTVVEAVIGQMYMAVVVARLVSLYAAEEFARQIEERERRRKS